MAWGPTVWPDPRPMAGPLMLGLAADSPTAAPGAPEVHRRVLGPLPLPTEALLRSDGKRVLLQEEIADGRPVFLNFIYTSCEGICPLMSQIFAQFQTQLGARRDQVHLISISIDPEVDTPARLREYARSFGAGPEWTHYTGSLSASIAAQRAFGVYNGDKMRHDPVTLVLAGPGQPWIRLDGFATAADLLAEFQRRGSASR